MAIIIASGGPRDQTPAPDHTFTGYHEFASTTGEWDDPQRQGSFEVFYNEADPRSTLSILAENTGFFWWPCSPGCLPDGDPTGPFPTAEGAYLDALGE